jgi:hypothetical protein
MAIDLTSIEQIPSDILSDLRIHSEYFLKYEFLDQLLEINSFKTVVSGLNEICNKHGVIGYHFTRSHKDLIKKDGLQVKTGSERRKEFLAEYSELFSDAQLKIIKNEWNGYFDYHQNKARDGKIWFALTKIALINGGAFPLLNHFGGEVVYMPLTREIEISNILNGVGNPLVIKCSLQTSKLNTFSLLPWGKIWLSTYHCHINSNAYQNDKDIYTMHNVNPVAIIDIEVLNKQKF